MATNKIWMSIALVMMLFLSGCQKKSVNLIQYVNPLIGTGKSSGLNVSGHAQGPEAWGQDIPAVSTPFGMTQWTPQTRDTENKGVAPYYYGGKRMQGFRGSHWLGSSSTRDYGSFTLMPMTGYLRTFATDRASSFLHATETSTPAYYSCLLEDYVTFVEMTATARTGFFKFSYIKPDRAIIWATPNSDEGKGSIQIDPQRQEIYGSNPVVREEGTPGQPTGFSGYFVIRFNRPFNGYGCSFQMEDHKGETEISGKPDIGAYAAFDLKGNDVILAKVGTSFTSIEAARANLEADIPHWDFETTRAETEQVWNKGLSVIHLNGEQKKADTTFYTALYHSMLFPRTFSDVNGSYPGFGAMAPAGKVEQGHVYYDDFMPADTYSAQLPLVNLVAPDKYKDMMESLVLQAGQGRGLSNLPSKSNYSKLLQDLAGPNDPGIDKNARHKKLDSLLNSNDHWQSNGQYLAIPYLYNSFGEPQETQKRVKNILSTQYNNYDGGIPGNDYGAQFSSWYVFSAMGFYPLPSGSGDYQLSSPIFSEVELNLDPTYYPGKGFNIRTGHPDADHTFNTVELNDKENGFVLPNQAIKLGGELKFSNLKRPRP